MKVWISKYALTKGLYKLEVVQREPNSKVVINKDNHRQVFRENEWHTTEDAALSQAYNIVDNKFQTLKNQINRLQKQKEKMQVLRTYYVSLL